MPDEQLDELVDTTLALGPKMVKTPDVTVQAHDPLRIMKARNMTRTKKVLFSQFPVTIVSPKCKVDITDCGCCEE